MRNLENEIWLPVKGYEGLYEVSNLGRVKSLKYGRERVLKPINHANGYLQVIFCKDGKKRGYLVHRLVAEVFLNNPHNLPEINHINKDKTDNRVENLEWCDRRYNVEYSLAKPVLQYTVDGELVREWPSGIEAQRLGGFNNGNISSCCSGKLKTHSGYVWKYKE